MDQVTTGENAQIEEHSNNGIYAILWQGEEMQQLFHSFKYCNSPEHYFFTLTLLLMWIANNNISPIFLLPIHNAFAWQIILK